MITNKPIIFTKACRVDQLVWNKKRRAAVARTYLSCYAFSDF